VKKVVCFIGPSGVGKTSYIKRLMKNFCFFLPDVVTTRIPRTDDDQRYNYVSKEKFSAMIATGKFIEWDKYNTYYYGTLEESVHRILSLEENGCVFDLTPQGYRQILEKIPEAIAIALLPDDISWLKKRLIERNTDGSREIEDRTSILESYIEEVKNLGIFVVEAKYAPSSWDATFEEIVAIINNNVTKEDE